MSTQGSFFDDESNYSAEALIKEFDAAEEELAIKSPEINDLIFSTSDTDVADSADIDDIADIAKFADNIDSTFNELTYVEPSPIVEVRRSTRRRKSVTAFREQGKIVIVAPARMSKSLVSEYVDELVERIQARDARAASLDDLAVRARQLSVKYLERDVFQTHHVPVTIRWVTNQNTRWGSCTPRDGSIRLSHRLQKMPQYVIDSVILHELVHLLVPGHGPDFYAWLNRFPQLEQADAYLAGYVHAQQFFSNEL